MLGCIDDDRNTEGLVSAKRGQLKCIGCGVVPTKWIQMPYSAVAVLITLKAAWIESHLHLNAW